MLGEIAFDILALELHTHWRRIPSDRGPLFFEGVVLQEGNEVQLRYHGKACDGISLSTDFAKAIFESPFYDLVQLDIFLRLSVLNDVTNRYRVKSRIKEFRIERFA